MLPRLNVVGCGRVGRSLGKLWFDAGALDIGALHGRSAASMASARDFIGAGHPGLALYALLAAYAWLMASPDGAIAYLAAALACSGRVRPGDHVFHCSGARAHDLLDPLAACGALTASARA